MNSNTTVPLVQAVNNVVNKPPTFKNKIKFDGLSIGFGLFVGFMITMMVMAFRDHKKAQKSIKEESK